MGKRTKQIFVCAFTFIIAFLTCTVMLLISISTIPSEKIKNHIYQSGIIWEPFKPVYQFIPENYKLSIDYFSDPILFNIMYYEDSDHPLDSILKNEYYDAVVGGDYKSSTMLLEAIESNMAPNTEYSRYWHGSTMLLRPLLLLFTCKEIYILNGIALLLLLTTIVTILFKKGYKELAYALLCGLFLSNSFMAPSCIEFSTMHMLSLMALLIELLLLSKNASDNAFLAFFVCLGVMTNFFDFLTTETMPFLTCLVFYFAIKYKKGTLDVFFQECKFMIKTFFCFGISYGLMWAMKWILTTVITDVNAFTQAAGHSVRWTLGTGENGSLISTIMHALGRNIGSLFPFGFMPLSFDVFAVIVVFGILCFIFLYRKDGKNFDFGRLLLIISFVPILRFIVLSSHSYLHFTMTHRALMPSVMAIFLIFKTQLMTKGIKKSKDNKKQRE